MAFDAAEYLDSEEVIAEYLNAALEDENPDVFLRRPQLVFNMSTPLGDYKIAAKRTEQNAVTICRMCRLYVKAYLHGAQNPASGAPHENSSLCTIDHLDDGNFHCTCLQRP